MRNGLLGAFAALMLLPVGYLLMGSLMGTMELRDCLLPALAEGGEGYVRLRLLPAYPTLASYAEVLLDSPEFFVMFWNSVKITAGVLLGQLLFGMPAAWGFARYDFFGKKLIFTVYIVLMMMPFQVMMLSNYLLLDGLALLNSLWGILLPGAFSTFPVFLMYRFFQGIPQSLIEAARLDGAGELRIFLELGLPLGSPGLIAALVLGFLEYWNLLEPPMAFLTDQTLWPLALFLPNVSLEEAGLAFASSILALLPAVFVFFAGRDYLEQGIVAAATKE